MAHIHTNRLKSHSDVAWANCLMHLLDWFFFVRSHNQWIFRWMKTVKSFAVGGTVISAHTDIKWNKELGQLGCKKTEAENIQQTCGYTFLMSASVVKSIIWINKRLAPFHIINSSGMTTGNSETAKLRKKNNTSIHSATHHDWTDRCDECQPYVFDQMN